MKNQRFVNSISLVLSLVILFIFGWIFFQFAINVPKWDDFAFIKFLADFNETDNYFKKIEFLFKQHNEHRLVTTRLVALFDFYIFGKVNFVHLMILGNLGLVFILFILYKQTQKIEIVFPLSVLWLNISFFENSFWGMASFSNFWVVCFVLFAIYLVVHDRLYKSLFWIIIPFLSIFSSGNGLIVIPLFGFYYIFQKNKSRLFSWGIYSFLLLFLYFIPYQKPPDAISEGFHFLPFMKGICLFLGSAFEGVFWGARMNLIITCIGFLIGSISMALSIYFLIKKPNEPYQWFFILTSGFVIATAVLVAFNRVGQLHENSMLVSRYKIYSALLISNLLVLVYQNYLVGHMAVYFRLIILGVSFIYYIFIQHYFIGPAVIQKQYLQSFLFNWRQNDFSKSLTNYYDFPPQELISIPFKGDVSMDVPYLSKSPIISEILLHDTGLNLKNKPLLIIYGKSQSFIIPYQLFPKNGFRSILNYNEYFKSKASIQLDLKTLELPAGEYTVFTYQASEPLKSIGKITLRPIHHSRIKQNW